MKSDHMPKHYRMVVLSMLLALGVVLGMVEAAYVPPLPIPGAKVGLTNLVSLILVIYFPFREALLNTVLRVVLVSLLTGTFLTTIFLFSLAGGVAAFIVMYLTFKWLKGPLTMIGVSAIGAVTHNMAQLLVAIWLLGSWGFIFHLPFLVITGVATGVFIGYVANLLRARQDIHPLLEGAR